jgi:hypothetical protein
MNLNKKTLLLACTITFSSLVMSSQSMAQESVCSNPLERICKETKDLRISREAFVKNLKSEIAVEARTNAAPRIDEMKKQIKPIHFIKRMIAKFKINNQEIMNSAKKRITGFEEVVTTSENIEKIKGYMYQAIDETKLDDATKATFKENIRSIIVGNFADYIERTGLDDNFLAQLLNNACGSDGLVDNAFATTLNNQRYVLICPGFLITLNQAASEKEKFNSILQAISHEMGHHIDNSKVGNEVYSNFFQCLATNYSDKFVKSKADQKFCKKAKGDVAKCNEKVVLSHSGELVADQWGIKVTALHAKAEKYSFEDADQMLVDSWAKLCGSGDEGIHPTGDVRMETLMRKNPNIIEALSCDNSSLDEKPACTIDGTIAIK